MTLDAAANPSRLRASGNPALTAALAVAVIAAATLAGAWFFQLVLDIRPCPLCLEQRYAYYLAVPLGFLVAFAASRGAPRPLLLRALPSSSSPRWRMPGWRLSRRRRMGVVAGADRLLRAGRQSRQRRHAAGTARQRESDPCDEVQWRFLGLSLAGYNVLISLLMAAIAAWGFFAAKRSQIVDP